MDTFRTKYRELSDDEKHGMEDIKVTADVLLAVLEKHTPAGREKSLAITKLEESVMWAIKGITG